MYHEIASHLIEYWLIDWLIDFINIFGELQYISSTTQYPFTQLSLSLSMSIWTYRDSFGVYFINKTFFQILQKCEKGPSSGANATGVDRRAIADVSWDFRGFPRFSLIFLTFYVRL